LTDHDRALAHLGAAEWLERAHESDPAVLGTHFERGNARDRAVGYFAEAAEMALRGNDLSTALGHVERGVACGATGEMLARLRICEATASVWLGTIERAEVAALEARAHAPAGSVLWCNAIEQLAMTGMRLGRPIEARGLARDLLLHMPASDRGPWALACANTTAALAVLGLLPEADELLEAISPASQFSDDASIAGRILRAQSLARLTRAPVEAYDLVLQAAEAFERAGELRDACAERCNAGFIALECGLSIEDTIRSLTEVLGQAQRWGLANLVAGIEQNLGLALYRGGQLERARQVLGDSVRLFCEQKDRRMEGYSRLYLADVLAALAQHEQAEREARQATNALGGLPSGVGLALAVLARILLARARLAEALETSTRAFDLPGLSQGTEDNSDVIRIVHAEVLYATGNREQARAVLETASEQLRQRVAEIKEETARQRFLAAVPERSRIFTLLAAWSAA
jgi:tetratricopeptide (TPR) repeat protein